jgi:hypothetical protein
MAIQTVPSAPQADRKALPPLAVVSARQSPALLSLPPMVPSLFDLPCWPPPAAAWQCQPRLPAAVTAELAPPELERGAVGWRAAWG